METFTGGASGKFVAVRCNRGDDILACMQQAIKENKIKNGVVISGIGTIDQCVLHYVTDPANAKSVCFKTSKDVMLEVTGMQGIIANGEPHLHMVVSSTEHAWAGHVEPGCRTLFLCEILIMVFDDDSTFTRTHAVPDPDDSDYAIMNLKKL